MWKFAGLPTVVLGVLSAEQRGNFSQVLVPDLTDAVWQVQCNNTTFENFNPVCLPAVMLESNDTEVFKTTQLCGLQAGAFYFQNLKPSLGVSKEVARTVFFNIVVAVVHFLVAAMVGTVVKFRKHKLTSGDEESPLVVRCMGPSIDSSTVDDFVLEKTEEELKKASGFSYLMALGLDVALPLAGLWAFLMALGTALTACRHLAQVTGAYARAIWSLETLSITCAARLISQVAQFGDTASLMALSTFTVVDLIPMIFGAGLICCFQTCNICTLCCVKIWESFVYCICFKWCIPLFGCIKLACGLIFGACIAYFKYLFYLICKCGCITELANAVKTCFTFVCKCGCCVCFKNLCCLEFTQCKYMCCLICDIKGWSLNCCCSCLQLFPYVGPLILVAAIFLIFPSALAVFCYGFFGTLLYLLVLAFTFVTIFAAVVTFSWCMFVVVWAVSQAFRPINKDLQWRGLKQFAHDFLAKLVNSGFSKKTQERLSSITMEQIKERIGDQIEGFRAELEEKKKAELADQAKTQSIAAAPDQLEAPLLQSMEPKVLSFTNGHGYDISVVDNQPLAKRFNGGTAYWKPKDANEWYKVSTLQTPAHYYMHDGDTVTELDPSREERLSCDQKTLGIPDADACKSGVTGRPTRIAGSIQQLKSQSAPWYGGMVAGPIALMFVLGLALEFPKLVGSSLLVSGDSAWLNCGPFSETGSPCPPPWDSTSDLIIDGCKCLTCESIIDWKGDVSVVDSQAADYQEKVCGPILGGCHSNSDCFGFHAADMQFFVDVSGFCHCAEGKLIYNSTVESMAQEGSIMDSSGPWLQNRKASLALQIWSTFRTPSLPQQIVSLEWHWFVGTVGSVNKFLHFLFVDTVWVYYSFALTETKQLTTWLSEKFYKAETVFNGACGWLSTKSTEVKSFADTQVSILAARAGIAATVGALTAAHHQ